MANVEAVPRAAALLAGPMHAVAFAIATMLFLASLLCRMRKCVRLLINAPILSANGDVVFPVFVVRAVVILHAVEPGVILTVALAGLIAVASPGASRSMLFVPMLFVLGASVKLAMARAIIPTEAFVLAANNVYGANGDMLQTF